MIDREQVEVTLALDRSLVEQVPPEALSPLVNRALRLVLGDMPGEGPGMNPVEIAAERAAAEAEERMETEKWDSYLS